MTQQDAPSAHILVVDDDERIRSLLRRFLMRSGFLVTTARDAAHARRLLSGLDFDLIVLDVMMPGEDGFSLTRDLRDWIARTTTLFADRLLPFGADEALIWGRLSARIGHSGADLLIAATALARDATVVTGNIADFRPSGCRLTDPFA